MPVVDNEVRGKLALVTGASGGIGSACARHLASQGVHLALTYNSNPSSVSTLIHSLHSEPSTSHLRLSSHQVDMSSESSIRALFPAILSHHHNQPPDILISNAGHGHRIPDILDIPLSEFTKTLTINLTSSFLLTQLCVPHMRAQHWGRIIFISSIAAYGGGINGAHYAASKGGLVGMCKNLATRLAGEGITVNDVAPAMVGGTGMIPDEGAVEGTEGDVKGIPVGRLGRVEEVAEVVGMFCRTGYMTGQSVLLSGGLK
ncbi:MAG: hypothetical protein Q9227_000621 [Pyrenula ochraceoflavens]